MGCVCVCVCVCLAAAGKDRTPCVCVCHRLPFQPTAPALLHLSSPAQGSSQPGPSVPHAPVLTWSPGPRCRRSKADLTEPRGRRVSLSPGLRPSQPRPSAAWPRPALPLPFPAPPFSRLHLPAALPGLPPSVFWSFREKPERGAREETKAQRELTFLHSWLVVRVISETGELAGMNGFSQGLRASA